MFSSRFRRVIFFRYFVGSIFIFIYFLSFRFDLVCDDIFTPRFVVILYVASLDGLEETLRL